MNLIRRSSGRDPYAHQEQANRLMLGREYFGLFMEQGTGKTKVLIDDFQSSLAANQVNIGILLAENGVHSNWAGELDKELVEGSNVRYQVWRSGNLQKAELETRAILNAGHVLMFLMNIEAMSTPIGSSYIYRLVKARKRSWFAIDESQAIKTPGSVRTKRIIVASKFTSQRRIATGTPWDEGIEDIYSQAKFLSDDAIGTRTFTQFKNLYCQLSGYEGRQIVGYQNLEALASKVAQWSFRVEKKDCLDLPEQQFIQEPVELTYAQRSAYEQMKKEMWLELADGRIMEATVAITRMMRLQQILCGFLPNEDGTVTRFPSNRADTALRIVRQARRKVIIFCRFREDVSTLLTVLQDASGIGVTVGFNGDTSEIARKAILEQFHNDPKVKTIVMTTATGGTGITLNEADTTIFYSNDFSAITRGQAEARNHRIGQGYPVTYYDLVAEKTIDRYILKSLKSKSDMKAGFSKLTRSEFDNIFSEG